MMTDIVQAIEKEKEYLSYRMKGEEPFHLVDAVKECGFESLDEYFNVKKDYNISNLSFEIIRTTTERAISDVQTAITLKNNTILFADTEYTLVWNGDNSDFNMTYCEDCNIPIYPLQTAGGTIVSTSGDLNIGICIQNDAHYDCQYVLEKLVRIFRKYTDKHIGVSGNDILIDGFKVLGSSIYNSNGMFVFITPVSFSDKTELISKICTKHSDKTPSFIDFMTKDELESEVRKWLLKK